MAKGLYVSRDSLICMCICGIQDLLIMVKLKQKPVPQQEADIPRYLQCQIPSRLVDNADVVRYVHHKAESVGLVHVLQVGAVTKGQQGEELADIKEMVEAGSPAISEDGKQS